MVDAIRARLPKAAGPVRATHQRRVRHSLEAPTEIITFGSDTFANWVSSHLEKSGQYTFHGNCGESSELPDVTARVKPRVVMIEMGLSPMSDLVTLGVAAQLAFKWVSLTYVFQDIDDELVLISNSIRQRKWSLVGRGLIDTIGIDRVLAGILTEEGLLDLNLVAYQTEMHEKSLESAAESSDEDEEDEDDLDEVDFAGEDSAEDGEDEADDSEDEADEEEAA